MKVQIDFALDSVGEQNGNSFFINTSFYQGGNEFLPVFAACIPCKIKSHKHGVCRKQNSISKTLRKNYLKKRKTKQKF